MKIKLFVLGVASLSILSCGGMKKDLTPATAHDLSGCYADSDYNNRAEGYDWVGVEVVALTDTTARIAVRSRSDIKTPTCRFDADASLVGRDSLKASYDGKNIFFTLKDSVLSVGTEFEQDANLLNFFCSGGASIEGDYKQIDGQLDPAQVDLRSFASFLNWNNFSYEVEVLNDTLFIQPYGLEIDNSRVSHELNGYTVVKAEIGDLNIDGFPEVLVYLQSTDGSKKGDIIGYSINNGKSMSQISYDNTIDDSEKFVGYQGNDDFAIVESTFVRRFPLAESAIKDKESPKNRQIQYKLIDGEASRVLTVDKVLAY